MNGRIYDPTLGRFLQADPHIQAPLNTQNYNRYSYVLNNPMSYTDPSGYFFKKLFKRLNKALGKFAPIFGLALMAIPVVGKWATATWYNAAAMGFISGGVATGSLKGALIGAFSGAAFQQIGAHFRGVSAQNVDNVAWGGGQLGDYVDFGGNLLTKGQVAGQIASHAVAGGAIATLSGGKFGHGFFSAGVTKGIGGAFLPGGSDLSGGDIVKGTVVSSVIGGTASVISGGKFANGAQTAAFQYLFNQAGKWSYKKLSAEYQRTGPMMQGKNFQQWAEDAIYSDSGGSCAARLSNAFNRAGYDTLLDAFHNTDFVTTGDGLGNRYILGAQDLALHLDVYTADNLVTDFSAISGKQGIIFFRDPSQGGYNHIDLYDGSQMRGNGVVPLKALKSDIYFKEL